MAGRTITKVKGAIQDLELGVGTVIQNRLGTNCLVDKIAANFIVVDIDQLKAFPTTARYAAIANGETLIEYWYDPDSNQAADDDNTVLPESGTGRWLKRPTPGGPTTNGVEFTLNFTEPSEELTVDFRIYKSNGVCQVISQVVSETQMAGFTKDANDLIRLAATESVPEFFRPVMPARIPLLQRWYYSNESLEIIAYIMIDPDGQAVLGNVYREPPFGGRLASTVENNFDGTSGHNVALATHHMSWIEKTEAPII